MIRPFKDSDVDALGLSADHRAVLVTVSEKMHALSKIGHGGTIVASDGTIVGVFGAGPVDPAKLEEADVFLFINPRMAQRYAGTLVKDLRHELHRAREQYKVVRAQGKDTPLFFRWFAHLGFKPQSADDRGMKWA